MLTGVLIGFVLWWFSKEIFCVGHFFWRALTSNKNTSKNDTKTKLKS